MLHVIAKYILSMKSSANVSSNGENISGYFFFNSNLSYVCRSNVYDLHEYQCMVVIYSPEISMRDAM